MYVIVLAPCAALHSTPCRSWPALGGDRLAMDGIPFPTSRGEEGQTLRVADVMERAPQFSSFWRHCATASQVRRHAGHEGRPAKSDAGSQHPSTRTRCIDRGFLDVPTGSSFSPSTIAAMRVSETTCSG